MKDRLQLLHNEEVFETRELALDYISDMLKTKALYAEPAVARYGKAQNPNIILAIGSVGDGSQKSGNRVFIIDSAKMEEDVKELREIVEKDAVIIEDLKEKFKNLIVSCGLAEDGAYIKDIDDDLLKKANSLNDAIKILSYALQELDKITTITTKNTETLDLHVSQDAENGTILSGDVKTSSYGELDPDFNDNILVKMKDGLFAAADLAYNENTGVLKFTASGKRTDGTVGVRMVEKEFKIGLHTQLVSIEYDADTETIILNMIDNDGKAVVKKVPASGLIDEWDVDNKPDTAVILTKVRNKEGKDKLSADVLLSSGSFNILKKSPTTGGLFVNGSADNIKFDNDSTVADMINNLIVADSSNLDASKQYTDSQVLIETNRAKAAETTIQNGLTDEINRAKAAEKSNTDLINIINGDNDTIGSIKKSLKDARAYTDVETTRAIGSEDNLQKQIDNLNGNEAVAGSVKNAIETSKKYTDSQVLIERDRAMDAETSINDKLTIINGNEAQVGSVKNAIEVSKRYTDDALANHDEEAIKKIDEVKESLNQEIKRSTITGVETNTIKINVKQIDGVGTTISNDVKISNAKDNILISDNAGLYVTVELAYSEAENALYFFNGTTDKPQKMQLSSGSLVHSAYYDASSQKIVLEIIDANGDIQRVEIPVGDLISGWNVGRKPESAVILTKEKINNTDYLYADVDVSTDSDNLLSKRNGVLKVSNQATSIMYSGTMSVKTKIEDLDNAITTNRQYAKDYTDGLVLTETTRAKEAELAERDRAMAIETQLQNQITAEVARATKAESDEVDRAKAAENVLDFRIGVNSDAINLINGDASTKGSINYMGKVVSENMKHLIEDETERAKAAEEALAEKIGVITGTGAGSMSDILDQAKKYTDNAVAPIPAQIEAAKNEAINTAALDATSKADKAKQEAISAASNDATVKVDEAFSEAKVDATNKANQAEANAIAAAAKDATEKANQAEANAKAYSDANQIYTTGATVSADSTKITVMFKNAAHNYEIDLTPIIKKAVDEAVAAAVAQAKDAIKYVGLQSDSCNVTVDNDASPRTVKVDVYKIDNGMFA